MPSRRPAAATIALLVVVLTFVPRVGLGGGCPDGDFGGCTAQCEAGDADSCSRLASMYRYGAVGVPRDEARATELYRRACSRGSTDGCTNLRTMYREGRGFDGKRSREPGAH